MLRSARCQYIAPQDNNAGTRKQQFFSPLPPPGSSAGGGSPAGRRKMHPPGSRSINRSWALRKPFENASAGAGVGEARRRHANGTPGARRENIETLSAGGIYCASLWFPDLLQEVIPSGIYPHLITNTFCCCSLFVFRRSVAEVLSG